MNWNPIEEGAAATIGERLQPVLVDLLGLALMGKQAHWTVVGAEFPAVHEKLDVIVELARTGADRVAERMVALGVVPDGQPDRVAGTSVPKLPNDWLTTHDTLTAVADAILVVIRRLREVRPALAETDPVSEGIALDLLEEMEQQHWMLRAQLA